LKYFPFYVLFTLPLCAQVLITEVMYDLDGTDSPNEFVELFNLSSTDTVDLTGWQIRDKSSTDAIVDSGFGRELPPLGYGLLLEGDYNFSSGLYTDSIPPGVILMKVDDSSIGNGLSANDSLYLIDSSGTIIDSLGWNDIAPDGFSIEKLRLNYPNTPNNWRASEDSLGTPGAPNSVLPLPVDGEILPDALTFTPPVISPGEFATLSITISNQGLNPMDGELNTSWAGNSLETLSVPTMNPLDTLTFNDYPGTIPFRSTNDCDYPHHSRRWRHHEQRRLRSPRECATRPEHLPSTSFCHNRLTVKPSLWNWSTKVSTGSIYKIGG